MADTIFVYNPTSESRQQVDDVALAWSDLRGRVVGIIDNAKPNFDVLAKHLTTILRERYGVRKVVYTTKRAPTIGATEDDYKVMQRSCDLIITGSGD